MRAELLHEDGGRSASRGVRVRADGELNSEACLVGFNRRADIGDGIGRVASRAATELASGGTQLGAGHGAECAEDDLSIHVRFCFCVYVVIDVLRIPIPVRMSNGFRNFLFRREQLAIMGETRFGGLEVAEFGGGERGEHLALHQSHAFTAGIPFAQRLENLANGQVVGLQIFVAIGQMLANVPLGEGHNHNGVKTTARVEICGMVIQLRGSQGKQREPSMASFGDFADFVGHGDFRRQDKGGLKFAVANTSNLECEVHSHIGDGIDCGLFVNYETMPVSTSLRISLAVLVPLKRLMRSPWVKGSASAKMSGPTC